MSSRHGAACEAGGCWVAASRRAARQSSAADVSNDGDFAAYRELMANWGRDDRLVRVAPLRAMVADWRAFFDSAPPEEVVRNRRAHGRTGRPLGSSAFLDR